MFRIVAIVILSAATVLAAAGWALSYSKKPLVISRSSGGSTCNRGWCYCLGNTPVTYDTQVLEITSRSGTIEGIANIGPNLVRWLPAPIDLGKANGNHLSYAELMPPGGGRLSGLLTFRFPLWIPILVFGSYPVAAFVRRVVIPNHRRRAGQCIACGYSLIGNESGTCPECGQTVTHPKRKSKFRFAAVVMLSVLMTLTAAGWALSFRQTAGHRSGQVGGHTCGLGWCIHRTYRDSDSAVKPWLKIVGLRGEFDGYFRIGEGLTNWLPLHIGYGRYGGEGSRFIYEKIDPPGGARSYGQILVRFPFWMAFLLFGCYPAFGLIMWVSILLRRRRAGKCVA
jgi:hypothetical protein